MSPTTYNLAAGVLLSSAMIALFVAAAYLVLAIVGWRGPNRKQRLVRFAIFLLAFPVLAAAQHALLWGVFLPSLGREARRERQERVDSVSFVRVGDAAPSFTITDTDGAEFVLDDLRGKVVLVNFFATWCGSCLQELPHVQKLWDEHRGNGNFALVVVGREETNESVSAFRSKHGYSFPIAADPERSLYGLYAKELIPRTYLVSRDGKICFASTGFYEDDFAKLKLVLNNQLRTTH